MSDPEFGESATEGHADLSRDAGHIKRLAARGAIWVTATSAAAIPLAYYRNWILGRIGETGEVVGSYAIVLLFFNVVVTFILFGGSSVVTNFVPKIKNEPDKGAFLFTYGLFSLSLVALFVAGMNVFPGLVGLLIGKPVDAATLRILSLLALTLVISQLVTFSLDGLMEFRLSALLNQTQILFVCVLATFSFFLFPDALQKRSIPIFAATIVLANLSVIWAGSVRVARSVSGFPIRLYIPPNFWRFSTFVHLNTISTFAYQSIDQLFVLAVLGTKELGAYFILWQCAQLITFAPQRVGQVMLASFARLEAAENHDQLRASYRKLCRIVLTLSTPLALFLVLFSYPVAGIFGEWCGERHSYLVLLAAAVHLGAIGGVNSMLIMSKERTGLFLANSLTLIGLQFAATLWLIDRLGVYGVIAGKAAGIVVGQIGLFSIIRYRLEEIRMGPPREYWIALMTVLSATALATRYNAIPMGWAIFYFFLFLGVFLSLIRFRPSEITAYLPPHRSDIRSAER